MQKKLYQVQQSTVKYRLSFRTLSDRNVKWAAMRSFSCRDSTSFPDVISFKIKHTVSTENLRKLSVYEKFYHSGN